MRNRILSACVLLLALTLVVSRPAVVAAQAVPPPEQFFGFKPGADGEMARRAAIIVEERARVTEALRKLLPSEPERTAVTRTARRRERRRADSARVSVRARRFGAMRAW